MNVEDSTRADDGLSSPSSSDESDEIDASEESIESLSKIVRTMAKNQKRILKDQESLAKLQRETAQHIRVLDGHTRRLQKALAVVRGNYEYEYKIRNISSSYWVDQGFNEEHAEKMQTLQHKLKSTAIVLRESDVNPVCLGLETNLQDGLAVPFDRILVPHYRELIDGLLLHESLQLNVSNIELNDQLMDMLSDVLVGQLKSLTLHNNGFLFIEKAVEFIRNLTKNNAELTRFQWERNPLSTSEFASLADVIFKSKVDRVGFVECCDEGEDSADGYDILQRLLTADKKWDRLDLQGNRIQMLGRTCLSDYISTDKYIKDINLKDNLLNDEDVRLIAEALRTNSTLRRIYLESNDITEIGRSAMRRALCNAASFSSIFASNNTCYVQMAGYQMAEEFRPNLFHDQIIVNNGETDRKDNFAIKMHSLILKRHASKSNAFHLHQEFDRNETYALTPNILEAIYRQIGDTKRFYLSYALHCAEPDSLALDEETPPLSMMFEIIRNWKIELFDNVSLPC